MCTYNAISSHTDHFEIQKRDSEESLLTFLFCRVYDPLVGIQQKYISHIQVKHLAVWVFAVPYHFRYLAQMCSLSRVFVI